MKPAVSKVVPICLGGRDMWSSVHCRKPWRSRWFAWPRHGFWMSVNGRRPTNWKCDPGVAEMELGSPFRGHCLEGPAELYTICSGKGQNGCTTWDGGWGWSPQAIAGIDPFHRFLNIILWQQSINSRFYLHIYSCAYWASMHACSL